jgi:hypothetical protein
MNNGLSAKNLHHAYGVMRSADSVAGLLDFFREKLQVAVVANPDFFHEKFETLTIDDSRRIKDIALAKRFSAESPRIFLIEVFAITNEAQNALLKLLEEPEEGNHFFLVLPSFDILLPTLRSRLALLGGDFGRSGSPATIENKQQIKDFLSGSLREKIAFVDALAADISDEKVAKHEGLLFLNDLEQALHSAQALSLSPLEHIEKNAPAFEAIARARTYMKDRAPSIKMLLEYVALNV